MFSLQIEARGFRAAVQLGDFGMGEDSWLRNLISSAEQKTRKVTAEREREAQRKHDLVARWPRYVEELIAEVKRCVDVWNDAAGKKGLPVKLHYFAAEDGFSVSGTSPLSLSVVFDNIAYGLTVVREIQKGETPQSTRYEASSNGSRIAIQKWDSKGQQYGLEDNPAEMLLKPLLDASMDAALKE